MTIPIHHKHVLGEICEALGTAFLAKDHVVAKVLSPQAPYDLIAVHRTTGQVLLVDVKAVKLKPRQTKFGPTNIRCKRKEGVTYLGVSETPRFTGFL